ncbi:MAG: Zinc D-Ala-D-Ala carboxypeptidase [Flavobacteriaceae bacterium]|nr:MAG: Zinc D-Ala-D-Ala carboxypeptidase [Flavobacteriaceae bacterium]
MRRGSRGVDVKMLQTKLGLKADGIFGPATEFEVKEFQHKYNLVADGIVGKLTLIALNQ